MGLPYPQERYQPYQDSNASKGTASASVSNVAKPRGERTPCHNPKSETESDLCAQWRAAKAAEKSAEWTLYGVIASAIGISLLLWQIMLTREALKDTGDATIAMREANEIAQRQQIAAIIITNVKVWIGKSFNVEITARNIGNFTAKSIKISARAEMTIKTPALGSALPFTMKDIALGQASSENSIIHFGQDAIILEAGFYLEPDANLLAEIKNAASIKNGLHVLLTGEMEWIGPSGQIENRGFFIFCNDGTVDDKGVLWIKHSRTSYYENEKE